VGQLEGDGRRLQRRREGRDEAIVLYDYGNADTAACVLQPNGASFTMSQWRRSGSGNPNWGSSK
jgi:hypothetical protein